MQSMSARGSGSARAVTIISWSALATMGALEGVRRRRIGSQVRAFRASTMRARLPHRGTSPSFTRSTMTLCAPGCGRGRGDGVPS